MLDLSGVTDNNMVAQRFNAKAVNGLAEELAQGAGGVHTNGGIYWPSLALTDGGSATARLTCTVKDRLAIAPGGTGGPAATQFDVTFEMERKDGYGYKFTATAVTGTTIDSTRADGSVPSTSNPRGLPSITVRTDTAGVAAVDLVRSDEDGAAATGTLTVGDVIVRCHSKAFCAPLQWFACSPIDFD